MRLMDFAPHDFVKDATTKDIKRFSSFVHRTFNGTDCMFFIQSLQSIYKKHKTLEILFTKGIQPEDKNIKNSLVSFREVFFAVDHPLRTQKHISNPLKNSSAKKTVYVVTGN